MWEEGGAARGYGGYGMGNHGNKFPASVFHVDENVDFTTSVLGMKATQCPNISTGSRKWIQRNDENWVVILVSHLPVQQVDVCEMVDTHQMQV